MPDTVEYEFTLHSSTAGDGMGRVPGQPFMEIFSGQTAEARAVNKAKRLAKKYPRYFFTVQVEYRG